MAADVPRLGAAFAAARGSTGLIPFITVLVAYPVVALDQIGIELQNPFSEAKLNGLPLDDITATIERNLTGLLADAGRDSRGDFPVPTAGTVS